MTECIAICFERKRVELPDSVSCPLKENTSLRLIGLLNETLTSASCYHEYKVHRFVYL